MRRPGIVTPLFLVLMMTPPVQGAMAAEPGGGYDADVARVRELFESRQFTKLTALLEKYEASCDRDIRYEYAAQNGFEAFDLFTPSYKALLDDWVRSAPGSWVPLTARASYSTRAGWKARGGKWASETTDEKFRRMRDHFESAVRDLQASLRIRPRQLHAYDLLMQIVQNCEGQETGAQIAGKVLEHYPNSYLLRRRQMLSLTPRWGGSYDAMARLARESAPYAGKNARLKTLPGFVSWDKAKMAMFAGEYGKSIPLFEKALSFGENWNFVYDLSECYRLAKMYDRALEMANRAIALEPLSSDAYGLRSKIFFAQGNLIQAMESLKSMERTERTGREEASEIREWEGSRLVNEGHWLFRKDMVGAIQKYTLAIWFDPKNADAYCWRGICNDRTGKPETALADLRKAVALNPRLYAAYKGLDDVLIKQRRFDEIIAYWTRYIELEPNNDNAYIERYGTYTRKADIRAAMADLGRACELGNRNACSALKTLRERGY